LTSWSFITVTYNSSDALRQFWGDGLDADVEWIVVDNASSDASGAVAAELGASRVIQSHVNMGFSRACNVGLREAHGEFIAFVNPDVHVDVSTLQHLADLLRQEDALVAPQLVFPDGRAQPNGRGRPTMFNKVWNRIRGIGEESSYYKYASPDEVRYVEWITGAAVCGRRETFELLGGWSERFFLYYEDVDLSFRAWRANIPVKLAGTVRWTHGWARDTAYFRLEPWKREMNSLLRFYARYPSYILGGRNFADDKK
jgi:N-acetylglucosaminyl-diphospho-decaprenol L-rhamnosyltransferase